MVARWDCISLVVEQDLGFGLVGWRGGSLDKTLVSLVVEQKIGLVLSVCCCLACGASYQKPPNQHWPAAIPPIIQPLLWLSLSLTCLRVKTFYRSGHLTDMGKDGMVWQPEDIFSRSWTTWHNWKRKDWRFADNPEVGLRKTEEEGLTFVCMQTYHHLPLQSNYFLNFIDLNKKTL